MANDPKDKFAPRRKRKGGTGQPPKEHRFQKGKSGNPGGRPKNVAADINDTVVNVLNTKLPSGEIVLTHIINSRVRFAFKGSERAADYLLDRYDRAMSRRRNATHDEQSDHDAFRRILGSDPRFFLAPDGNPPTDDAPTPEDDPVPQPNKPRDSGLPPAGAAALPPHAASVDGDDDN